MYRVSEKRDQNIFLNIFYRTREILVKFCTRILPRCIECMAVYAGRTSRQKGVRPSVCLFLRLSVKRVDCDKTEEKSVQIFIPYERSFTLVF